jgi:hypothetical protein
MEPVLARFAVNGPYIDGTITASSGVVTLVDGTWPTWAADGEIDIDGVSYTVDTRDSDTVLTLDNLTVTEEDELTYTLSQNDYDLPDLFGAFVGDLFFRDIDDIRGPIERVDIDGMLRLRQFDSFTSRPTRYSVWTTEQTGSSGQRWMMSLWPNPDIDLVLTGRYTINPLQLTATLPYPMGGQPHSETLREACLAAAETEIKGEVGLHSQLFMQRLITSVSFDRRASNPGYLGSMNKTGKDYSSEFWDHMDYIRWADRSRVEYV